MTGPTDGETAPEQRRGVLRVLGLGLVTGAADDDCSAIGTYAAAGAKLGLGFLWTAPALLPMMFGVVYLSAKLGQVAGTGLFGVIRAHCSRWVLYPTLIGVLIGNTIEAGADLGGMAAALDVIVPVPFGLTVVAMVVAILALQLFGSYVLIRNVFRWLALTLLAYVGAAFLARPDLAEVLRGTFVPTLRTDEEFLSILVAVIGTSLSAYLYTWQSNEEVEEEIAQGRVSIEERRGATDRELQESRRDIWLGMIFSNLVMYFILLSTGATLHPAGIHEITTAAQAAEALRPLAGDLAGLLFAVGVVSVGFLAVPVMTTGAAYDLAQTCGWKHGLHLRPREAKAFYAAIVGFTLAGAAMNAFGFNPMKFLVWSGIVQGFSTPPLLVLLLWMTNRRAVMGERVNSLPLNLLGGFTTIVVTGATVALVVSWVG